MRNRALRECLTAFAAFSVFFFIASDAFPKQEGGQCAEGKDWSEILSSSWCRLWSYVTPEQMTALFTVILGISTIGLWAATWRLSSLAASQSKDMKDSIAVAKESADAAKRSAEITEKAFTLLERPYVIPEDIGDLHPIQYFGTVSGFVQFQIGNYGKVPAIVHRVTARFAMIELPVTQEKLVAPNYSPGETRADEWVLSKVLMSGAIHQLPQSVVPVGMQKVEIEIVQGRARPKGVPQHAFFLSIRIEYEDAANGTMRHAFTLWELGLGGFARYGGKNYNHERQIDA